MDAWTRRVRAVVRSIPPGRVASYGMVAMLAGRSGAARAVGKVMSDNDDPSVPCHRVVHADGSLAAVFVDQRARLRREGVRFAAARVRRDGTRSDAARVDLRTALWTPRLPRRRGVSFSGVGGSSRRTMRNDSAAL